MYFHRTLLATVIPLLVVPICAAPAVGAEPVPAPATIIGTSLQAKIHHSSVHAYPHLQFRRKQHMSWQDAKEILKDTWNVVKDIVPCAEDAVGQISGVLDGTCPWRKPVRRIGKAPVTMIMEAKMMDEYKLTFDRPERNL